VADLGERLDAVARVLDERMKPMLTPADAAPSCTLASTGRRPEVRADRDLPAVVGGRALGPRDRDVLARSPFVAVELDIGVGAARLERDLLGVGGSPRPR